MGIAWLCRAQDPRQAAWKFTVGVEQRTRYETANRRYRPGESGGDQQLPFRTRLQASLKKNAWSFMGEVQDSRAALTDSGSTVNSQHVAYTKLLQLHAAYVYERFPVKMSAEAGRFRRDFGGKRQVGSEDFRNTNSAFDGIILKAERSRWSIQAFNFRPVSYTFPDVRFDERLRHTRLKGLFFSGAPRRSEAFEIYLLHFDDGDGFAASARRRFYSGGVRLRGSAGPFDYEIESIWQRGRAGALAHRASLYHAQAGYRWANAWRPVTALLYDYASGDADPSDIQNNAFDSLYGLRRFEFGPTGIWGIYARSNLNSPAALVLLQPRPSLDLSVQHRLLLLAQPRDQWRGVGLWDPTGRSGSYVGQQTEYRLRFRWKTHFVLDTGLVLFREGSYIRLVRRQVESHWARYYYAATEWKF